MTTATALAVNVSAAAEPTVGALLDGVGAAAFVGVSAKTWRRWGARGFVPLSVHVGARRYWRRCDLEQWIAAGCPKARRFQVLAVAGFTP